MAKLLLGFNDETISEFELNKKTTTIGRKSDNDIRIDNLAVSGHHAKIVTILNSSFIEDLNSTNGTFINGKKIKNHALSDGEVIQIGKHSLTYINDAADAGTGQFESTVIVRPDTVGVPEQVHADKRLEESIGRIQSELASDDAARADQQGAATVKFLSGANKGRELRLRKKLTTLGQPGVQVAAIARRPTGYFLIAVDASTSATNPLVNGNTIGRQAHPLNNGDAIEVAGIQMAFELR